MICGVDYGSKMAGTTAIASLNLSDSVVQVFASAKGQDADAWISEWLLSQRPNAVFLDAPLSLPGVYRGLDGCTDYFYRACDRQAGAMSPMFLGGLTARAMRLASVHHQFNWFEAYPGGLARTLGLATLGYKQSTANIPEVVAALSSQFALQIPHLHSWHQVDAVLAMLVGLRHHQGTASALGEPEEGLIWI